ncbi:methyltransferase [Enterococcus saigonensis]|uniref:Methyltransferase n=2 Tax=Enterococcus saigonensis TaxID=1805431 RepID=A0A679IKA0_9ENTE|nr:methyltransferase [Enterococcus saigonensis]
MKNIYDNENFFYKYSQMSRSQKGLAGAGEWQTFQKLLPNFNGKSVLDLGCGYGWHCLYAAEHGAKNITGVDLSQKMLTVARQKTKAYPIHYVQDDIATVSFLADSFDIVISSLAIHYVADFASLIANIKKYLKPEGILLFSVEHPAFTAEGSEDWYYDVQGNKLHYPLDNYFTEGLRETNFLEEKVVKYHRTLTTYLQTLLKNNFILLDVVEPMPPKDMLCEPGMKDELRRPMMLLVKAKNKKS